MITDILHPARRSLGDFEVARALPSARRRMVGPFIFLDHMGPADFAAGRGVEVRPHPHIGLSTLTFLFEGEITHRDSLGVEQPIRPGEANWMTAGRGITHSERTSPEDRARGSRLHGVQAWAALPDGREEVEPEFAHFDAGALPGFEGEGLAARLIAGEAFGARAPARTHSPLFYAHWRLAAGARAGLPPDHPERAAFLAEGAVEIAGTRIKAGRLVLFAPGDTVLIEALEAAQLILFGGEPVGPRHIWWNFVSSSPDRIEAAKADWAAGRMKLPDRDSAEFIPLPDDPPPPPQPMS